MARKRRAEVQAKEKCMEETTVEVKQIYLSRAELVSL
jgi:hypothetical protein